MKTDLYVKSKSLFNFFLDNNLPQEVNIFYNSRIKYNEEWLISPVVEGRTYYTHYIPLDIPINGYYRIVFSKSAIKFILDSPNPEKDLQKLRVKFYPWPMIILPSQKMLKSSLYNECDSIDNVYIRFGKSYETISSGTELKPSYSALKFGGFIRNEDFIEEKIFKNENVYRRRAFTTEDDYCDDYDTFLEKQYDAIISGEAMPYDY